MLKACVCTLPSADSARTTMPWLCAASASSAWAIVTTPVVASMAKRPPALSLSE